LCGFLALRASGNCYKISPPSESLPERLDVVFGDQLYFEKSTLTPWLRNRLVRIAAFQNLEFYRAQTMRLTTYGIPRIVVCAEDYPEHIALPRGCLHEVEEMLTGLGVQMEICDQRNTGKKIKLEFHGELRPEQREAVDKLQRHDIGVLAATTAFGKTVVAAWMIAKRSVNTLIIVHTKPLLEQWRERLSFFYDIPIKEIGVFGGGKRKPGGAVDIAIMQSLIYRGAVRGLVGDYGHVVFDECHHLSAPSFEAIARRIKAKYVLGLSATVMRKDGKHPIILMQCGPIRHKVDARLQEETADCPERILVATGKFIGEGFDDPRLDTLLIALPVSWRGTVAQYAGRLHREYAGKREVVIHDYADLNTPMLARMFERRCKGYEAIGYSINLPASAMPGWPVDVLLPSEPSWKNTYAVSVKRLVRDGVDNPLGNLFLCAARDFPNDAEEILKARSASEAFLFRHLETLPETHGKFRLNDRLAIPFGGFPDMEVDLSCREARIAVEIDGRQHLNDSEAYRRDRNKDLLLQENGWIVLRCLAEDIAKRLDALLDDITRLLTTRRSDERIRRCR